MNEAELFGQRVRVTRKACKMNLGQLAEKANTGVKHLGRIERGEKQPSFELIIALSRAMSVSPATLFQFEDLQTDQKSLKDQLRKLLDKQDSQDLRKLHRIVTVILEH